MTALQFAAPAANSQTCISSSGSWANAALSSAQTATFRLVYDATPSARVMDAVAGLSSSAARDFTSLAVATHFDVSGAISVRNGSEFTAANRILYSPGVKYHFILDVNVSAHTYSAYVVVGSTQTTLGTNLKFRSEQSAARSLNDVGDLGSVGSLKICNIVVTGTFLGQINFESQHRELEFWEGWRIEQQQSKYYSDQRWKLERHDLKSDGCRRRLQRQRQRGGFDLES